MKTKKKVLLAAICMAALVLVSVLGTMAYLTSRSEVNNTFTVGSVSITLDEAPVDENGQTAEGARVTGNSYKLIPGHTYSKDPQVHIAQGSEDCYVRMLVTYNKADEIDTLCPDGIFNSSDWNTGYDPAVWVFSSRTESDDNTVIYEFRYKEMVPAGTTDLEPLLKQLKMPGSITGEQIGTLDGLYIKVTAEAIQADGFDSAEAAFTALDDAR